MSDIGHDKTDKELKRIEKLISKEYKQAAKELDAKLKQHFADFDRKDAKMQKMLSDGDITEQEYNQWRIGQMATGQRWTSLRDSMTDTLVDADKNATRIVQQHAIKAYADNMNYGTYEIEHGAKINTGFTLYDEKTVLNLMKKNPNIVPMPRLDIPKDELWNRQKLTSAVLQGILQGESVPKIADRLSNVAMMDRTSALRNARTYTTAAENKGREDSYERAQDLGIQTNKKWIATLDDRTRAEHRHLDGMSVPYDANFEVDGYTIEYPGDPSADPEMFYNCRCTLVADIVGYSQMAGMEYQDVRNDEKLGDMSYDEWKHALDTEPREGVAEGIEPETASEPESDTAWIDRIKEIQQMDFIDEDSIKEAGQIITEQIHSGYLDNLKADKAELMAKEEDAKQTWMDAKDKEKEISKLMNAPKYEEAVNIKMGLLKPDMSDYFNTKEDASNYLLEIHDLKASAHEESMKAYQEWMDIRTQLIGGGYNETADLLVDMLSQVREMGSDGLDIAKHLNNSRSEMRQVVEWAYSKYPTSWIKQSMNNSNLSVKKADRGYYADWKSEIAISGDGGGASKKTAIHELGHRMEDVMESILRSERIFYDRRTDGEKLEWLGAGYGRDEKTRKDDFIKPYMGKDYGGSAYELVSMGFELAYCDPLELAKDPDMESWIYGLLAVIP